MFSINKKKMEQIVVVYGFEYDWKIWLKYDSILCKSIASNLPVYASPTIIEDSEMIVISDKIRELEKNKPESFHNIDKLASIHNKTASWKLVRYGHNLQFVVGYESEGDEDVDQDGRASCVPTGSLGLLCPGQAMLAEDTGNSR
jgi:hypothetical protein